MRTLALVDRDLFPPRDGETIPNAAHIRALSELGDVDIGCIGFTPQRPDMAPSNSRWFSIAKPPPPGLTKWLMTKLQHVPGAAFADPARLVEKLVGRHYDLVYVTQLRLIDWARAAKHCLPDAKMILGLSDSPTELHRRMWKLAGTAGFDVKFRVGCAARGMRLPNAPRWERQAVELFDRVMVQSKNDYDTVASSAPAALAHRVIVAPNGINEEVFSATYQGHHNFRLFHMGPLFRERRQLVLWFIRKVFKPLWQRRPNTTLHLVGAMDKHDQAKLNRIPGVHCHGFVDDLQDMLQQSTVSVAPMMMRFGLINKIAESMAAGLPASGLGAFSGIPGFVNHEHGVEATTPEQWVDQLDQLLGAPERLQSISVAGRELIRTQLRWQFTDEIVQEHARQLLPSGVKVRAA